MDEKEFAEFICSLSIEDRKILASLIRDIRIVVHQAETLDEAKSFFKIQGWRQIKR